MKTRIVALFALTLLATSGLACRHHHEGPVDKAKDVIHDVGHDVKEAGHDIKEDIKR